MTPNATAVSAQTYAPRTVAMRKEANKLGKTLKPLLEKKRRARINESLDRLKALILPLTGKDNWRYSKLEKADILDRIGLDIQSSPSKDSADSFKEGKLASSAFQRAYRKPVSKQKHAIASTSSSSIQ